MSYQSELANLAIKSANGSFTNVVELSKILKIFGSRKEVKTCWVESCEDNGLLKATAHDYYSLAGIVSGLVIVDYKDAKASSVTLLKSRLEAIGVTSVKTLKAYKKAQKDCATLAQSLMEFRSLDSEDNELEDLISALNVCDKLASMLLVIDAAQEFIASMTEAATDEAATDEAATDEAATDEAATDEAATDEAATDEAATDEAATDEAATDEAATDEAATDEAATDEAATDEAVSIEQMQALRALISLMSVKQLEAIERAVEARFETLRLAKVA